MGQLTIDSSCFERELKLRKTEYISGIRDLDFAAVFLLWEMLRKLYLANEILNTQKNEEDFELLLSKRFLTHSENEQIVIYKSQLGSTYLKGGFFGSSLISCYSTIEVCKLNGIIDFPNPYEHAMITIERGTDICRENYPKSFDIGGFYIPINLKLYNSAIPYLVCTENGYLNAINNYYNRTGIDFYETETPTPPWLKDDNERGHISEEYKNWL